MQFILLKIKQKYKFHGYDDNNSPLQEDFSKIKTMKFSEVIIPLSEIRSIGKNHITIQEDFGRLGMYEYECEGETSDFFENLKEKLLKANIYKIRV